MRKLFLLGLVLLGVSCGDVTSENDLQTKLDYQIRKVEDLQRQLENRAEIFNNLFDRHVALEAVAAGFELTIAELTAEVEANEAEIKSLTAQLEEAIAGLDTANAIIEAANGDLEALEASIREGFLFLYAPAVDTDGDGKANIIDSNGVTEYDLDDVPTSVLFDSFVLFATKMGS